MLKTYQTPEDEPVPPECRTTVDRIQTALDGAGTDALDADPHATACAACRERVRAARVLLCVLAMPSEPVAVPEGFADRVVEAMKTERYARIRRRSYAARSRRSLRLSCWPAGWRGTFRPAHLPSSRTRG